MAAPAQLQLSQRIEAWVHAAADVRTAVNCRPRGPLQSVSLARVMDGDTIAIRNGEPVRVIGINAPELGREGRPDEAGAVAARDMLQALLSESQRIWLVQDQERYDRYGRQLAHVYADPGGSPVAVELLRQGLGWHVAIPPNLALQDCYAAAEAEARARQRGVWGPLATEVTAVQALREGGFARVDLTIERVVSSRTGWWLETDGPLVLQLRSADLDHFVDPAATAGYSVAKVKHAAVHPHPPSWVGERWRVRGWIVDRSASRAVQSEGHAPLVLQLRHPAMVEMRVRPEK